MPSPRDNSILIEAPVPMVLVNGELGIEAQAWNGISRWMENFDRVTFCAGVVREGESDPTALSLAPLVATGRLTLVELPYGGWNLPSHLRQVAGVRRLFRSLIPQHQYFCFSSLGWWCAWGTVAASEARRQHRPYAVWLDYVLHEMPGTPSPNPVRNLIRALVKAVSKPIGLRSIRQSALGLFHGRSVYEGYLPYSSNPQLVHDIHLTKENLITPEDLDRRLARTEGGSLVGYVGRVHPMKGPKEWLSAVSPVLGTGPADRAVWLGDGPMLDEMRRAAAVLPVGDRVEFAGNESDRAKVLAFYRSLDLFVFCHLTPESPRNLIEALMSGVPIVGFDSPYARDLLSSHAGGVLVPVGDVDALASQIRRLLGDREARADLSRKAVAAGQEFDEATVFRHRSDLVKQYLG